MSAPDGFFTDSQYYTGEDVTDAMIRTAEQRLGVRLPESYLSMLHRRNGGVPRARRFDTDFPTSWARDHFEISAILGLGGTWGIDSSDGLGGLDAISEWGYPDIGVVICDTPSAGHDTVMLDYRRASNGVEPVVVYVDDDRVPRLIAPSFADFVSRLHE